MLETRIDHRSAAEKTLLALIEPILKEMGYDLVALFLHRHKGAGKLQLFIDHLNGEKTVGVEDCVAVSRALDPELDQSPEVTSIFPGSYELEVSSPGVERPLTRLNDFRRFTGQKVRIHTLRSLNAEELGNTNYFAKNPKQKNFIGLLKGLKGESIEMDVSGQNILIPFELLTKAHLDPDFDQILSQKGTQVP